MKNLSIKTTIIALLLANAIQLHAQQFTLSGKLSGQADAPIILYYINSEGKPTQDSTVLQNGSFTFTGNINGAVLANLSVSKQSSSYKLNREGSGVRFFLEPVNMVATGNFVNLKELKFTRSKSQAEFESFTNETAAFNAKAAILQEEHDRLNMEFITIRRANEDDIRLKVLDKTLDSLNDAISKPYADAAHRFIASHNSSYVSVYLLEAYKSMWKFATVKTAYDHFDPRVLNGYYGGKLKTFIDGIENNSAGKVAKSFTSVDLNGKQISLSDFKGKYTLLDFWGSWCIPCRKAVPHVKDLFAKYHNKGFEVVAIAVDDKPADWKKAIAKDGTGIWSNIMIDETVAQNDSRRIDNDYNIHVYPSKVLVDKNGMIIGRYDGTDSTAALDKKLAEIFGTKD